MPLDRLTLPLSFQSPDVVNESACKDMRGFSRRTSILTCSVTSLQLARCCVIFEEVASSRRAVRPELEQCLKALRSVTR